MLQRIFLMLVLPGAFVALSGCEREQEGTPLEPAETSQQEQPAEVDTEADTEAPGTTDQQLHTTTGTIESIDQPNQQITISHEAIESLGWPQMTMPFGVANPEMLNDLEAGTQIEFSFREGEAGQYVVEEIRKR